MCAQLFRSLFSAVMCGALARAQKVQRLFGPLRLWPAYAVRGFPGAASMVFYYQAIAMLPLSDAVRCPFGFVGTRAIAVAFVGPDSITCSYFFTLLPDSVNALLTFFVALLPCPCRPNIHLRGGQRLLPALVANSRPALLGMTAKIHRRMCV